MRDDWRLLGAGTALDREIAERLGWKVYSLNDNPWGHVIKGAPYFAWRHEIKTDDAWHDIFRLPIKAHFQEDDAWTDIGAFSTNLDDAFDLLDPFTCFGLMRDGVRWGASINSVSSRLKDHGDGLGETPALAICRAWLDWDDRQKEVS